MTLIVRFMNQMDADGMNVTARSYTMQIANFSYCIGAALAQANAIMTGWRIGAKEFEECDRGTRKAVIYGLITATCFSAAFAMSGHFIIHIFTDDTQMINLVVKLLIVDIFLEFGRVTNLVYGQALKPVEMQFSRLSWVRYLCICLQLAEHIFLEFIWDFRL